MPSSSSRVSSLVCALVPLVVFGGLAGLACDPAEPAHAPNVVTGLPRWDAREQQAFDDSIDVAAVGLALDGSTPRVDAHLRERAQTADVVARVRVRTVTLDTQGETKTYHLSLQVAKPPLVEARIPDPSFDISIKSTSSSFAVARALDARLQGMTFVGFMKRYAGEEGEPAVHWHLSADTADVAAAVQEAVVLGQIAPSFRR